MHTQQPSSTPSNQVPLHGPYGEVFDRGYRRYDGPRRGRQGAITSLIGYSMKRAMGIRKSWTAKILPFLLYVAIMIPLIIQIGMTAIVPDVSFASYSTFLQAIFLTVGIFVGTAAPEMICVDRHERTLPLYFSRAINRFDYVVAKVVAMSLLAMTMTVMPSVLLWLGRQLTTDDVWGAMRANIGDLGRVVFAGAMTALVLSAIGLAVSSFTNRKGVAIALIMFLFVVVTAMANVGIEVLDEMQWSRYLIALHLPLLFLGLNAHLFRDVDDYVINRVDLQVEAYIGYMIGVVIICLSVLLWRYVPRDEM